MKIGVIGGSGLEKGDIFENISKIDVNTPYGKPSSRIKKASYNGADIFLISRHGLHHEITPSRVNNRANIHALKDLGCKYIIATTAVGSLKEEVAPGNFVIPDQFIDFTKHRKKTFYDDFIGGAKHTSLADPFSEELRNFLMDTCEYLNVPYFKKGTILTIEGPGFSTRAESNMFRQWGADLINMSTAPEASLAKEIGLDYAVIAMSTDYDCWKETDEPSVTWKQIDKIMKQNSSEVKRVITKTIETIIKKEAKEDLGYIKSKIRTIPNFPKPGVMFRDITTLLQDPVGLNKTMNILYNKYKNKKIDKVAGVDARGFIFGGALAEKIGCGFVPIRKKGKLPGKTISQEYELEYGTDRVEIHQDSIKLDEKILLVDDLIATGGTALASAQLIERLGGKVEEIAFIVDLPGLKGKEKLSKWPVYTMVGFEGE